METIVIRTTPCAGNPTGAVTINKDDFDPRRHELFDEASFRKFSQAEIDAIEQQLEEDRLAAKKAEDDEDAKKAEDEGAAKKSEDQAASDEKPADSDGGKASGKKRGNR